MASSVNPISFSNLFLSTLWQKGRKLDTEFVEKILDPSNVSNRDQKEIEVVVKSIKALVFNNYDLVDRSALRSVDELYTRIFQITPKDKLPEKIRKLIENTQDFVSVVLELPESSEEVDFPAISEEEDYKQSVKQKEVKDPTEGAGARDLLKEAKEVRSNPALFEPWVNSLDIREMIEKNDPRLHKLVTLCVDERCLFKDVTPFFSRMMDVIDIENPVHCQFLKELFTQKWREYRFELDLFCCFFGVNNITGPDFTAYDQCMKALKFLKAIEKSELLKKNMEDFKTSFVLFKNIFCFFNPENTRNLEELFAAGFPIDIKLFSNVLNSQNYEVILVLLKYTKQEFVEQNSEQVLRILMEANDLKVTQCVFEHMPSLLSKCTFSIIKEAVQDNYQEFIDLVIDSIELSTDSIDELLSIAKENYNLKIIRKLCEKRKPSNYLRLIGIGEIKERSLLVKTLTKYALMSPLQEVYDLIKDFPQIAEDLPDVLRVVSLVVRYPNFKHIKTHSLFDFKENFSVESYLERTITYGIGNRALVSDLSKKLNELSRDNILDAIIENRVGRGLFRYKNRDDKGNLLENPYQKKRVNDDGHITPLRGMSRIGALPISVLSNRYSNSWKALAGVWYDGEWNPTTEYASAKVVESSAIKDTYHYCTILNSPLIQYSYSPEGSEEEYPTTLVAPDKWVHTPADTIKKLQPHLEDLQKEIVGFPLDRNDPKSMKLFFEKVARGYWLIATLCETHRGTPHNAMIWLNLIYEHHKLPPPIPKMDNFFLDNTALMLPLEKMIEDWESFFEPIFPNVREAASSQQALQ